MGGAAKVQPFGPRVDVFRYLQPLLVQGSLMGLRPPRLGRRTVFWSFTSLLLAGVSVSCLFNIVDTVEEFYDSFEAFQILVSCFAFVFLAASGFPTLERLLQGIDQVDLSLAAYNLQYRYDRRGLARTMVARMFLVLLVAAFDAYSYEIVPWTSDGVANIFSYYYFYFLFDHVQLQYDTLALTIGSHFQLINDKLEVSWRQLCQSEVVLASLLRCQGLLCEVSELLEELCSQQLLVVAAFVFCNNTSHAYCMISTLQSVREAGESPSWFIFSLRGVFIIFRLIEIVWLIRATTYLQEQANKSLSILSQLLIVEKQPVTSEIIYLHLSMKQEVHIWACGCFQLDNALLLTMLSAATTYIMVLIQYAPEKQPEFNVID